MPDHRFHVTHILALTGILAAGILTGGCGIQRAVVRSATAPIINGGFEAMMAEEDLQLAETALASNLKLVEGLIRSDAKNDRLVLLAAQGFTAYSLAFLEDEEPERAKNLYLRGRDYANRWLELKYDIDLLSIDKLDDFKTAVDALPKKAIPGIFWLANSWASSLLLSLDDIAAVSNLPRVEYLMNVVLEEDEAYYFAGAHLFMGAYYGARSTFLGGSPAKAARHLDRQAELTNNEMLLGKFFRVKFVFMPAFEEEAARKGLEEILTFDVRSAPEEMILMNRIAQKKARVLLENLEDYF